MPELPLSEKFVALVEDGIGTVRDLLGQISPHQIRVYEAVRCSRDWMTAREISAVAADVAERTANRHARMLAGIGVFERHCDLPGYRYRLCATPDVAAQAYMKRLETAKDVLGAKHERVA
jgi:hypothetical protein